MSLNIVVLSKKTKNERQKKSTEKAGLQKKGNEKISKTQHLFFLYIPTEILLYTFEYFYLHYITKWLLEAMFVNFLSWATCDKEINYVGSG